VNATRNIWLLVSEMLNAGTGKYEIQTTKLTAHKWNVPFKVSIADVMH